MTVAEPPINGAERATERRGRGARHSTRGKEDGMPRPGTLVTALAHGATGHRGPGAAENVGAVASGIHARAARTAGQAGAKVFASMTKR